MINTKIANYHRSGALGCELSSPFSLIDLFFSLFLVDVVAYHFHIPINGDVE